MTRGANKFFARPTNTARNVHVKQQQGVGLKGFIRSTHGESKQEQMVAREGGERGGGG